MTHTFKKKAVLLNDTSQRVVSVYIWKPHIFVGIVRSGELYLVLCPVNDENRRGYSRNLVDTEKQKNKYIDATIPKVYDKNFENTFLA